jgi:hypothetical protein
MQVRRDRVNQPALVVEHNKNYRRRSRAARPPCYQSDLAAKKSNSKVITLVGKYATFLRLILFPSEWMQVVTQMRSLPWEQIILQAEVSSSGKVLPRPGIKGFVCIAAEKLRLS